MTRRDKIMKEDKMTYEATIETVNGPVSVSYTDPQIDGLGGEAAWLRDQYRLGVFAATSEVAARAYRQEVA